MFDIFRRIIDNNPRIQEPSTFHNWVLGNYGRTLALQLRRLADNDSRTYSLRRLIGSIFQNHKLITRRAYLNSYKPAEREYARRAWIQYTDASDPDVLPRGVCDGDLKVLERVAFRAVRMVDRDIAHLDRRRRPRKLLYDEMFAALEIHASVTAKYADLVGYRMADTVQNGAYGEDWVRLFEQPWVVKPRIER